jgi:hypothetical protein
MKLVPMLIESEPALFAHEERQWHVAKLQRHVLYLMLFSDTIPMYV